ncbi:MAG: histidine phosphatase family protein [Cyclobacteriaceae bacterium]|nr:histidine phosphatase family protein [Cyclobacteriaceae bacterium]
MSSKKIYLIRHGQTDYNKLNIVQGRGIDTSLSKEGHRQAKAFFEAYKHIPFRKIYTSTLQRTHQTVKPFIENGYSVIPLPGLDEISWGCAEGMTYDDENNKQYYQIIESWKKGNIHEKLDGGESPLDIMARQKDAFDFILSDDGTPVLVCLHGRALKIMLAWLSGKCLSQQDTFHHDNLSLYILNVSEDGKVEIEVSDDRSHLDNVS